MVNQITEIRNSDPFDPFFLVLVYPRESLRDNSMVKLKRVSIFTEYHLTNIKQSRLISTNKILDPAFELFSRFRVTE